MCIAWAWPPDPPIAVSVSFSLNVKTSKRGSTGRIMKPGPEVLDEHKKVVFIHAIITFYFTNPSFYKNKTPTNLRPRHFNSVHPP